VKIFILSIIFYAILALTGNNCCAQEVGSLDLLNNAKEYDQKTITYKGEVIGDVMMRGDHAWLHVNDGYVAIGIWASKGLIRNIFYSGNYRQRGDLLEVSGIFHKSCLEHGGDLDIHASEIRKLASGGVVIQPISKRKVYVGIVSLMLVLLFLVLRKFHKNKQP